MKPPQNIYRAFPLSCHDEHDTRCSVVLARRVVCELEKQVDSEGQQQRFIDNEFKESLAYRIGQILCRCFRL